MALPNTETRIPTLMAAYAETRRADLSLPDSAALPFIVAPFSGEQLFPRVVFVTSDVKCPHPLRMYLTVSVELQTSADQQNTEVENAWTAGLRHILADVQAFQTWLQAQPVEERTGFRITKYRISADPTGMTMDDKQKILGRKTDVTVHVRTDELAPPAP